jgi:hypothetical protein
MKITAATLLINNETLEYPVSLFKVRQDNPTISFAAEPDESLIEDLGYSVVQSAPSPTGDVVTEDKPEQIDGVWTQKWAVRDYTTDELAGMLTTQKAALSTQIDTLRDAKLGEGFQYDFGGTDGVLGVQLRERDCLNITGLRVTADGFIAAGQGDQTLPFRTLENKVVMATANAIVAMSNAAFQRVSAVYGASWTLKEAVDAATVAADLPVIPATLDV